MRLAQANFITKTDVDSTLLSLNQKITKNKTKHLLVKNDLDKLKNFDWSYFICKSHFEGDVVQNYLVFQPIVRYFKVNTITTTSYVSSWKSKGLSAETIKPPTASDNSLTPELNYYGTKTRVKFTGSCLKQPKVSYTDGKVVKVYIVYELGASCTLIVYLVQLLWLKMLVLIGMDILVMELDLIEENVFHFQVVDLVKIY